MTTPITMGVIHSTKLQTDPTGKSFFRNFSGRLDRTDPLSFGPKFPEILVEWIAPYNAAHDGIFIFISYSCGECKWKVVNAQTWEVNYCS